jgi:secreted trypsin-like serine protease
MVKYKVFLILVLAFKTSRTQTCINENVGRVLQYQKNLCYSFSEDAIDLRVVGGASINISDASWHTIIARNVVGKLDDSNMLGGGNLITTRLVLTAAHVFWSNSGKHHVCPKKIRELESAEACHSLVNGCPDGCHRVTESSIELYFGVSNLEKDQLKAYKIDHLYFHPGYNKKSLTNDISDGHDIAILRSSQPVELSPSIQPICLPHPNLDSDIGLEDQDVSVNGFGRDGKSRNAVVETLQQGCLYIVGRRQCKKTNKPIVENAPYIFADGKWEGDQICATGAGVDSCQGDGGGGLVVNVDNFNIIIGVTSFGSTSCRSNFPAMYTNIMTHRDWIQNIIEDDTTETKMKKEENDGRNIEVYDIENISERLVVLGGWVGNVSQSDTVFMETCPVQGSDIPDLPLNISHGVAAVVKSKTSSIIFCGGIQAHSGPTDDCFEFDVSENALDLVGAAFSQTKQWTKILNLGTKRGNAAIDYLPSKDVVWITGGRRSGRIVLDSTEILTKQISGKWEVKEGPKLTRKVAGHCTVTLPTINDEVIVIGGASFDSKERKFVMTDTVDGYAFVGETDLVERTSYPSLGTPRSGHACTVTTDSNGEEMIIVAGGQRASKDVLDSVESIHLVPFYLSLASVWSDHSSLPRALTGATFITKLGLPFLIGGAGFNRDKFDEGKRMTQDLVFSKDVLSYDEDDGTGGSWKKTGEVAETIAYHVTLALENDICVAIQKELNRELRDSGNEGEKFDADNFLDIR